MNSPKDIEHRSQVLEAQLISALKDGSTQAFEAIYNIYFQRLYVYCFQFTKSSFEAEDIVQDVFTKLWIIRKQIKLESSLKSLLFTIARNKLISAFRRNLSSPIFEDYLNYINLIGGEDANKIELKQFEQRVMGIIEELPPARRKILYLSRFEHLTNKQIAKMLKINEQSVKNSISQSLKFLRNRLKELLVTLLVIFVKII